MTRIDANHLDKLNSRKPLIVVLSGPASANRQLSKVAEIASRFN
jgi:hypothetical protein